jgi:hypothetical protein
VENVLIGRAGGERGIYGSCQPAMTSRMASDRFDEEKEVQTIYQSLIVGATFREQVYELCERIQTCEFIQIFGCILTSFDCMDGENLEKVPMLCLLMIYNLKNCSIDTAPRYVAVSI